MGKWKKVSLRNHLFLQMRKKEGTTNFESTAPDLLKLCQLIRCDLLVLQLHTLQVQCLNLLLMSREDYRLLFYINVVVVVERCKMILRYISLLLIFLLLFVGRSSSAIGIRSNIG